MIFSPNELERILPGIAQSPGYAHEALLLMSVLRMYPGGKGVGEHC